MSVFNLKVSTGNRILFAILLVTLFLLIVYPLSSIVVSSILGPQGLTTHWFDRAFHHGMVIRSLPNTLFVVVISSAASMAIGTTLAWFVKRADLPFARYMDLLSIVPLLFPPLLGAIGWAFLVAPNSGLLSGILSYVWDGLNIFSIGGVVWVLTLYTVPWSYAVIAAGYDNYDHQLYESSRTSGRSLWSTVWNIELPMLRPHLLSAALLTVVFTISNYPVPLLLAGTNGQDVLVTVIYRMVMSYREPKEVAAALAVILMVIALVTTFVQMRLTAAGRYTTIAGKGSRKSRVKLGRLRYLVIAIIGFYFLLAIVLPLAALIWLSFLKFWSGDFLRIELTLSNYVNVFFNMPNLWTSFVNSAVYSLGAATIVAILACLISYVVLRTRVVGRSLLDLIGMMSAGVPSVIYGLGVLFAFIGGPLVLYGTPWILIVAYVGHHLFVSLRSTNAALLQIHPDLDEAARTSGAGTLRVLTSITFPLVRNAIGAGWILSFILMFREFPMSMMLYSPSTRVVGVTLFDQWDQGAFTEVAAYAVLIFLTSLVIVIIARRLSSHPPD